MLHIQYTHTHIYPSGHIRYCAGVRRDKSMCTLGEGTTKSDSNQILFMQSAIVPLPVIYDIAPEQDNSLQNTNYVQSLILSSVLWKHCLAWTVLHDDKVPTQRQGVIWWEIQHDKEYPKALIAGLFMLQPHAATKQLVQSRTQPLPCVCFYCLKKLNKLIY